MPPQLNGHLGYGLSNRLALIPKFRAAAPENPQG